jgi:hypothetical protein
MNDATVQELRTGYKKLQLSLQIGARVPLDNSLNPYMGLMPHVETYLTKDGTLIVTGESELPGVDADEYVDGILDGTPTEERGIVIIKLKKRLSVFKSLSVARQLKLTSGLNEVASVRNNLGKCRAEAFSV